MGLFAFKKPKWSHKDPAVRLASVADIDPGEIELLSSLSRDPDRDVRRAAINRLDDLTALSRLAEDASPEDLPVLVARRDSLLFQQTVNCQDQETWREDLDRIASPELLAKLAVEGGQPEVRLAAVNRIDDQRLLAGILKQNCGKQPAMAALAKITDEALLADLSERAASKTTRRLAAKKIAAMAQQRNPPSDQELIAQKLHALAAEAARLRENPIIDSAALRLVAIRQEWQALDRENTHPAAVAFHKICTDFEDRYQEILGRRQAEQDKAAGYEQFQARLQELCAIIERQSCSAADDAETVKEQAVAEWAKLVHDPAMVPSPTLTKRFTNACRAFAVNREKIDQEKGRVRVLERKCAEIRELIAGHDLKKAAARLAEAEKSLAPMRFKYFGKAAIDKLVADAAAELKGAEAAASDQNLARRQEICAALEQLTTSDNPGHIERQLQARKQEWQQLAKLEAAEGREVEQRYQAIVAALTGKRKTLEHAQDWELWANLTLKEKLAERVAALDLEENPETVLNAIKESQAEWKQIGAVPHKESQRVWDAFQGACHRNFERARPFLEELKSRRDAARDRRREICVLAAELAESDDWQKTTLAIKGMQEEWKNLPHGSRREEQQLYQRFREACDRFFARREEHFESQDKERSRNLIAKEKLCEEAEQLAATPQIEYPKRFKLLQSEWKKIGPAPRKSEEAVWQRFRAACDTYFQWLAAEQEQNLQRKVELCEAVEKILAESAPADNQKAIAARLAELQQQWKEIGPVPPDQGEAVWQRFRGSCDQFFAARHQQFEKEDEERRGNQVRKEEILARAEELAGRSQDKETAAQLQALQKEWFATGPAPRVIHKELNDRFKSLCNAFFADRRQYFTDLQTQQLENQKKKEGLCLRLENILGLSYQAGAGDKGKALSLAEELKQAMEDNFMLAGRRHEKKDLSGEVKRIQQEWDKIGPVPPRQIRPLTERYKKALDAYYKSQRPEKT